MDSLPNAGWTESVDYKTESSRGAAVSSTVRAALKSGLIGGAVGGLISAGLNYTLLPFPQSAADNAFGHGMSGFFCGLLSGFVGVLLHARAARRAA